MTPLSAPPLGATPFSTTQPAADTLPLILVVDDEPSNLQLLRQILKNDYRLAFAKDGPRALELAREDQPALVLLDVMMPGMSGHDVCRQLKRDPATSAIPVIFVSALSDPRDEVIGFGAGAVDYIAKPVSPPIVLARIRTHLSLVQVDELKETRLQIVQRLGLAAEYKDNETGLHVIRMSQFSRLLGVAAGMTRSEADNLLHAAPMHDVGKIGIPDRIILKPGPLDPDEWVIMKTHAAIGGEIIGRHRGGLLGMAHEVAVTHHEKWDGSGYPHGLKGEQIPLVGRIASVADVFDALTSVRPYKQAWTVEQATDFLREKRGSHFDARLVDLFLGELPAVVTIMERWAEAGEGEGGHA